MDFGSSWPLPEKTMVLQGVACQVFIWRRNLDLALVWPVCNGKTSMSEELFPEGCASNPERRPKSTPKPNEH